MVNVVRQRAVVTGQVGCNNMKNSHFLRTRHGFTLIELMITITVLSILLLMGSNLTRAWIDRSQVNNTITIVKNTMSQAKTAALRNPQNSLSNAPSVSVCLDSSNTLHIVRANVANTTPCNLSSTSNSLLQSVALADGVSIKHGAVLFACLSFNSRGMITANTDPNCSTLTHLDFEVKKNNEIANIKVL